MEEILLKMAKKELIEIKFIKEFEDLNNKGEPILKHKKGDIVKASKENAKQFIELGYAEYIEEEKTYGDNFGRFVEKNEIIIEDISEEDILMVAGKMKKANYYLEYWKAPRQIKGGHLHIKDISLPEIATIVQSNKYKELIVKKYVNENLWEKVDWNFYNRGERAEPHRIVTEDTEHYKGYGIKTLIRTWGNKKENHFEEKIWEKAIEECVESKIPQQDVENWNSFIDKVIPHWIEGKRQEISLSVGGYLRKDKRLGIEKVKSIITEICKKAKDNEIPMRLKGVDETFKKDEKDIKGYSGLEFLKGENKPKVKVIDRVKGINYKGKGLFTRRGQIEEFWKEQPFFYDKSKIFWIWDLKDKKWIRSDEVDFLNAIQKMQGVETLNSKNKAELVEGFKQIGRQHFPKPIKKEWVQFLDKIYDVQTGENFEATPEYFVTNPIPWKIGESEDTPAIDKLFLEWVGENDKKSLYEFIAYNISLDKFMQRIFAFCGGGSNGKGTFIKLNYKFLGEDNCVSSEIKSLSEDKFEPAVLYRKLLCVMGEVSYGDLRNTNQLKKLAGEDKISFQFKGKTPFTDENTATCVCLTNSLPATPDKSLGFYRKWKIEDFPNQFTEISKDLIKEIPEVEFENLAKKSLRILKELYEHRKFNNEGSFEERMDKY